jgi:hypothetical protein
LERTTGESMGTIGGYLTRDSPYGKIGFPITYNIFNGSTISHWFAHTGEDLLIADIDGNTCIASSVSMEDFSIDNYNAAISAKNRNLDNPRVRGKYYLTNSLLILQLKQYASFANMGYIVYSDGNERWLNTIINYPWGDKWCLFYLAENGDETEVIADMGECKYMYIRVPSSIKDFPIDINLVLGPNNVNVSNFKTYPGRSTVFIPVRVRFHKWVERYSRIHDICKNEGGVITSDGVVFTPGPTSGLSGNGLQTITTPPVNAEWIPGFTNQQVMMAGGGFLFLLLLFILLKKK